MGSAMGWSASETRASSMWEFFSAWNGYVEANSPKGGDRLSESERDALWADVEAYGAQGPREVSTTVYGLDGVALVRVGVVRFWVG